MRDPLQSRKRRQVAAHAEKRLQERDQSFKMFWEGRRRGAKARKVIRRRGWQGRMRNWGAVQAERSSGITTADRAWLAERAASGWRVLAKGQQQGSRASRIEMNEMGKTRIKGEGRRQLKAWMGPGEGKDVEG
jgi:hypothetical protein